MPRITYIEKRFRAQSLRTIDQANQIIAEYQADGLDLTVRQLYYQFVARGLIENKERNYKNLGSLINDARMAGYIDWNSIVDRTRNLHWQPGSTQEGHWDDPASIISAAASSYRIDKWADQPNRVEVWVEKEALTGILDVTCPDLDVAYFACRGYVSQSEMWRAAMRHEEYRISGQETIVIHLGDHDPSGVDMTRDNRDRFIDFGIDVEVNRIALNMDQIQDQNPPPNPAKLTDSRANDYVRRFGNESWELDALNPRYLRQIITDTMLSYRDDDLWNEAVAKEDQERLQLEALSENYDTVTNFLEDEGLV